MKPHIKRLLVYAAILAFVVFVALFFYFELKGSLFDSMHPSEAIYNTRALNLVRSYAA